MEAHALTRLFSLPRTDGRVNRHAGLGTLHALAVSSHHGGIVRAERTLRAPDEALGRPRVSGRFRLDRELRGERWTRLYGASWYDAAAPREILYRLDYLVELRPQRFDGVVEFRIAREVCGTSKSFDPVLQLRQHRKDIVRR